MYRQEFIDNVTTWSELLDFCYDEDCNICDDIYPAEERDDYIDNYQITDWVRCNCWREVLDILKDIPDGCDYYQRCDGDWYDVDEYLFDEKKQDVLAWMDEGDWWEDDTHEDEADEDEDDLRPIETEDISLMDLLISCNNKLKMIGSEEAAQIRKDNEDFNKLISDFHFAPFCEGKT